MELSEDLLRSGVAVRFQARGGSMYPFIRGTEIVQVVAVPASGIKYADIVLLRDPVEKILVHRVVKIDRGSAGTRFFTKGDCLRAGDGWIDGESILGKVTAVEKPGVTLRLDEGAGKYLNTVYTMLLPLSMVLFSFSLRALKLFVRGKNPNIAFLLKEGRYPVDAARALGADSDIEDIFEKAAREGVFYPLCRCLIASGLLNDKTVPQSSKLDQSYRRHLADSVKYSCRTDGTLKRLDATGIRLLLLKGPAVDSLIYDGYFRPRADIDIAVAGDDMVRLGSALRKLGYTRIGHKTGSGLAGQRDREIFVHDDEVFAPLHIHRKIANNTFLTADGLFNIDIERVWGQTERFGEYCNIVTLKPEIHILYLCEHALKHDFGRLVFLYEIERLVDRYGDKLDWSRFVTLVREFGMEHIVYYGLYFAKELLDARVSEKVIMDIRPKKISLGERMFTRGVRRGKSRRYSSYFVYLAARKAPIEKLKFLFNTVFPPRFGPLDHIERMRRSVLR